MMITRVHGVLIAWLVGILSLSAFSINAAPVSGTINIDLIVLPIRGGEEKISSVDIQFSGDLALHLSVGGLDLSSTSAFTFRGLEFQALTAIVDLGIAQVRDTILFAPNIVEIQQQRNLAGLPVYCVSFSDPSLPVETDLTFPLDAGFPSCPVTPDNDLTASSLYYLLEGYTNGLTTISSFVHPIAIDLIFSRIFEGAGHLDQPLSFRKKIVDLALSFDFLRVELRGLFANLGSVAIPSWQKGFIGALEVHINEIIIRSETWLGATPGLECFGECSLIQRFHEGVIAQEFMTIEERLFIRGVRVAGMIVGAQVEFSFDSSSFQMHIVELTQQFTVAPLALTIFNTVRIGKLALTSVKVLSQSIVMQLRISDVTTQAVFNIWPPPAGVSGIKVYWSRLVTVLALPNIQITSDIQACQNSDICGTLLDTLTHDLALTTSVGDIMIRILLGFNAFVIFRQAAIDVSWQLGNVLLKSTTVVNGDALILQMFGFTLQF
jgi:hypothetical protein